MILDKQKRMQLWSRTGDLDKRHGTTGFTYIEDTPD